MQRMRGWILCAALTLVAASADAQGRRGLGSGMVGIVVIPEVQQELKLEQAQKDKLLQWGQEQREQRRAAFQDFGSLSPDDRQKRLAAFSEEQDRKLVDAKILNSSIGRDRTARHEP